jgi:hypothetical protein
MASRGAVPSPFLNGPNYTKIVGFLRNHYSGKLGVPALPERIDSRLQKTVQHYMQAVAQAHGNKPPQVLNNEVLRETTLSMDTFLKRKETGPPPPSTVGMFTKPDEYNRLFEDTNTRYENIMADRAPAVPGVPALPDFRISADMMESNEDPVLAMQRLQKARDAEAKARGTGLAGPPPTLEIRETAAPTLVPPQADVPPPLLAPRPQDYIIPQEDIVKYFETEYNVFLTSSDRDWLRNTSENRYNFTINFNTGQKKSGFAFNAALQNRFRNIQRIEFVKAIVPVESLTSLVRVFFPEFGCARPLIDNSRIVNVFSLPFAGIRIAELNNNGFSTNPEEDNTFAIVQYDTTWSSDFVSVSDGLTYKQQLDNKTGPVMTKSGYTGLIPKFLRTQKVYNPTPLATLQKLSIRLERHDQEVLSTDSDVQMIRRIAFGDSLYQGTISPFFGLENFGFDYSLYYGQAGPLGTSYGPQGCPSGPINISNPFIVIKTNGFFLYSAVGEGDLIQIKSMTVARGAPLEESTAKDFETWLNRDTGHYVCGVGYEDDSKTDVSGVLYPNLMGGRNPAGYCNLIVIQNRFNDPRINDPAKNFARDMSYFGGSLEAESALVDALNTQPNTTGAGLINLSRQTHIVLRIITRDMDSAANIRPDNV